MAQETLALANVSSASERTQRERLIHICASDIGYFASMKGYDAQRTGKGSYNGHENFIVYNRTALVVQDEYVR